MPEPFKCPQCGGTEFHAFYPITDRQDVTLFAGEDGMPDPGQTQYDGNTQMAGDSSGDDEEYACVNWECGWIYNVPADPEPARQALLDMHRMLFPERYETEDEITWDDDDNEVVKQVPVAMYEWHAGTIEDVAAAIERALAGDPLAVLEAKKEAE